MAQRTWLCGSLLALGLSGATAAWAAAPGGPVPVAESRNVADYDLGYRNGYNNLPKRYQDRHHRDYAEGYRIGQARRQATGLALPSDDYVRGYSDGLNGQDGRDRNSDYRTGYRAGRAKHEANAAQSDGRDYARGYRDGYNRYRERAAVPSSNRAYAEGFRAGQTEHTAFVGGPAGRPVASNEPLPPPPGNADNLVGRPAVTLDRDMTSLGFVLLGKGNAGKASVTTWQSRQQNKCLRITSEDGKVQYVVDVDNTNCT
jgi:hypothetical protein